MRLLNLLPILGVLSVNLAAQSPAAAPPAPPTLLGFAVSGSATIGSQYIFRGLTQTDGKPTIQGELDLVHPSGFYLSTSLSNISWYTDQNSGYVNAPVSLGAPGPGGAPYFPDKTNSASVELDLFGGYKWGFAKDWTLDVGLYRYLYPGTYNNLGLFRNPATTEAYLGLTYSWASLKCSQVLSATTFGTANAKGTTYVDLSLAIPLGDSGFTLLAHGGRTTYAANDNALFYAGTRKFDDNSVFSYTDYRVGVAKEISGYTFTLAATGANGKDAAADGQTPVYLNVMGRNIGGSRLTFTLAKAF
ncbi:TorF family putative porin [Geothrix sp. PMB-07]|uniref:TorF family putative porin n=1 Tax=Geothrix sp. PMB-07 TaxID=3068640 RepID=UPI0027419E80|nr:TorF family putative porin [Geothrix sp. PMB-07]WLT31081.1 TorF family putative porin [Geothrix sp. PMB-07]